jgi:polyhydroxyalkanoate synthesis regulator phasin
MGQEAWRAYVEMALGMTEASRKKATKAVKRLLGKGGATAEQLQGLAEELVHASVSNREALSKLVRFELDRALGKVGLATADELAELNKRVRELESQLRVARGGAGIATSGNGAPVMESAVLGSAADNGAEPATVLGDTVAAAVTTPPVKKVTKKAVKRAPAAPTAPAAPAAKKAAPAKRTPATRTAASATPIPATPPARKAPARKAPAKKATGGDQT